MEVNVNVTNNRTLYHFFICVADPESNIIAHLHKNISKNIFSLEQEDWRSFMLKVSVHFPFMMVYIYYN